MLPDYVKAKAELRSSALEIMGRACDSEKGDIPEEPLYEGDKCLLMRQDGTFQDIEFLEHRFDLDITPEQYSSFTWADIHEIFVRRGEEMGKAMFLNMIEEIQRITKETGNIVDGTGLPSASALLQALQKVEIEFNHKGQPCIPSVLVSPEMVNSLQDGLHELEVSGKLQQLLNLKRERWRDREIDRRLVDEF